MKTPSSEYTARETDTKRKPAELFYLYDNSNIEERYTSGDVAVSYGGNTYEPAVINREAIEHNSDLSGGMLTLMADNLNPVVLDYIASNPPTTVWVEVYKLHRDQSPLEADVLFVGFISSVSILGTSAKVVVKGFESLFNLPVCRDKFQRQCQHQLGDDDCGIDIELWKFTRTVSSVSSNGLVLTIDSSITDDILVLGYVTYTSGGVTEYRMITANSGTSVTIRYPFAEDVTDVSCDFYYGCSGDITVCVNTFNNLSNFLGFPYVPIVNPARIRLW